MNWPGENLIIKLWECLAEKGVGSLLKPWQIRREGRATIDLRRYEMLTLAEAERESEELRSGRRKLQNAKFMISLTEISHEESIHAKSESVPLLELASQAAVADSLRKEINVAKAVLHAEEELRNDETPPQEQKLEDDWLYRWRDYAGSVSSEELQAIWGRILAGELKSPGHSRQLKQEIAISLRARRFLWSCFTCLGSGSYSARFTIQRIPRMNPTRLPAIFSMLILIF